MSELPGFNVKLFPHQLKSIQRMEHLETTKRGTIQETTTTFYFNTKFGILGDIPGYGKSFSVVGMLLRNKMNWDMTSMYKQKEIYCMKSELFHLYKETEYFPIDCNLLVVSPTLIQQWEEYLSFSTLRYKSVYVSKDFAEVNPGDYDVIILSSTRYNEFVEKYKKFAWKRFLFDEASSTNIANMKKIVAGFYWFVTATYNTLITRTSYRSHFLKNLFDEFNYSMINAVLIKNPDEFVKASFQMPSVHYKYHVCISPQVASVLQGHISFDIQQMISAGNIRGAIEALGGKDSDGDIVEVVTSKLKYDLKEAELKVERYSNNTQHAAQLEFWNVRVETIQKKIKSIEERVKETLDNDTCPICTCNFDKPVLVPCCQHIFCGTCIFNWLKTKPSCPMCRCATPPNKVIYVRKEKEDDKKEEMQQDSKYKDDRPLSKTDTIIKIIQSDPTKRVIVFSSYDETFEIIRKVMGENNIGFVEIAGHKTTRNRKISQFKSGEKPVLFLNSRFNGAGLNLAESTDIVLYHTMPEHLRTQVIGRAMRVGRKVDLLVHELM